MRVGAVVVSIALAMLFGAAGIVNAFYLAAARKEGQHLRISSGLTRFVGMCQLAGAVGLLGGLYWRPLGIAAASGLMLLMAGAVISHRRVRDSVQATAPALAVFGLAGLVVGVQLALLSG